LAYLLCAVTVVAGVLVYAFQSERDAAVAAAGRTDSAVSALTAMLDQETGMRGFLLTGQEEFLSPYVAGRRAYERARTRVHSAAAGDHDAVRLARTEDAVAGSWQALAADRIAARRHSGAAALTPAQLRQADVSNERMDAFRTANTQLRARLDQRRNATLRLRGVLATLVIVALAALLALAGFLRMQLTGRRQLADREKEIALGVRQRQFADLIQAVNSEDEAHELVQRHLERCLPSARATVLTRNNSDNRLKPATELEAGSMLNETLADAEPRDCLAIRLGRPHRDGAGTDQLTPCIVCSSLPGTTTCQPLLVAGKVIGSVLIGQPLPPDEAERCSVADTVAQAAPVLANLKTIAIAENRASTDALTGLPNRRAMQDTLKRMAAHAGRSAQPLAAIAFDLDHFKSINDSYGHATGDAALSAVGECLRTTLRGSDFAARVGGEEFLVLAPDTDIAGAVHLAEVLREALTREEIPHLTQPLTASFGVAVIPDHAATPEALLRAADRACYAAKDGGRNRVEATTNDSALPRWTAATTTLTPGPAATGNAP
jgi:diguanylate cyclase (GGDEF)-like protein